MSSAEDIRHDEPVSKTNEAPSGGQISFRRRIRGHFTYTRLAIGLFLVIAITVGAWRYRITRPDYRLARGQEAVANRQWKSAEHLADRLQATGHFDHEHLLRAELCFARKQYELALKECNQIRGEGAIRLRAAALSGRCLLELGAPIEAERVFLFVLSEDRDSTDAHRGLAIIAYDLGHMNRATAHLEQVIRLDPTDARPHRLMAEILRSTEDTQNAVGEYREALRIGTGLSAEARDEVWFGLVEALVVLNRFADSLAALDEAAAGRPSEPNYMQALRIESLRGVGRRAEATAIADQALANRPEGPFFRLRGQLYLDEGNAEAAIPLLERAVKLSPGHYQSHFLLAQAYSAAGRKAEADRMNVKADEIRQDYESVVLLSREAMSKPNDPAIRLRLAEICDRLSDAAMAAKWRKAASQCQLRKL